MTGGAAWTSRLVVGLAGPRLDPREREWLARHRPAGVILFARNVIDTKQLTVLCAGLHRVVPGLEIVADHEGGPVSVLAAAVGRPPAAATLGLLDDPELTWRVHRDTARRLAACGLDRVLAPVADVLTEPRNPVIGVRSFGCDPEAVARHVAAAVAGLRQGGVDVCLKHWPGHGGTGTDSHLGAAILTGPQPDAPFRAGLEAGADAVMVAHVLAPGGAGLPASLDPAQAAAARDLDVVREPLLYADDITMGALRAPLAAAGVPPVPGDGLIDPADLSAAWCRAVLAGGCDRLLVRGIPWGAFPDLEPGPALEAVAVPGFEPPAAPSWEEAARRLAAVGGGLPAGEGPLLVIDRTGEDRWGPIGGGGTGPGPWTAAVGTAVVGERDAGGVTRVVACAHRPLDRQREAAWAALTAPVGAALGVGHPALAADLAALLPAAWGVSWLPEWPAAEPLQKI